MRSFWRTVAGKTTLFLSTVLCTVLFAVSIVGFTALIASSAYMLDKTDFENQLMCQFFSNAMEDIVHAYAEDPKTNLDYDYVLKDSEGKVLKDNVSAEVRSDDSIDKIEMDYFVSEQNGNKILIPAYDAGGIPQEGSYKVTLYLTSDAYIKQHDTGDYFWIKFLVGLYDFKNTFFFAMVFSFLAVVILTISIMTVAAVFLMDHPYPFIFCRIFIADQAALIRRSVVNDDDLDFFFCLSDQTVQAGAKIWFDLIDRYDDADVGMHGKPQDSMK